MRAILAMYMIDKLGVDQGNAGTYMSLFIAACYFFPLIGGWIADNLFGKYWTIVLFSVPYVLAQFIVGIENKYVVLGSLVLLAMGSGVIKPNISTLMGMTYDQQRPGMDQLRSSAFSWFYMAINIGAFLSQSTMPWLRDEYGYQIAFVFPAVLMAVALIVFAAGKRFYAEETIHRMVEGDPNSSPIPDGRTITGIPIKTTVVSAEEKAATQKLRLLTLQRIGLLFLTVMFFWAIFDQSASTWIFFANTYMDCTLFGVPVPPDAIQAFNALFIILMVPISVWIFKRVPIQATNKIALGYALTALSMVIMSFSGFLSGDAQKVAKVTFPEGSLILPLPAAKFAEVPGDSLELGKNVLSASDLKYVPETKKLQFSNGTLTLAGGEGMAIVEGHLQLPLSNGDSPGVLESQIKSQKELSNLSKDPATVTVEESDWVPETERVTVWWQVLAYLILTAAEVLVSITGLELAFVAAPASMKSFVTACWLAVVFLANLLINAPITQMYPKMTPVAYFGMLGLGMVLILLVYFPIARKFNAGMEEGAKA